MSDRVDVIVVGRRHRRRRHVLRARLARALGHARRAQRRRVRRDGLVGRRRADHARRPRVRRPRRRTAGASTARSPTRGIDVPFNESGFLYFPRPERREFARLETHRLRRDVPIAWLDERALERRFGHLLADTSGGAVWEPDSGWVDRARRHPRARARGRGARRAPRRGRRAARPRPRRTASARETSAGELRARAIVLATGVRTPGLLDALGIEHDLFNRDIQVDVRAPPDGPRDQPAFIDDVYDLNGRPDPASGAVLIGHPTGLDSVSLDRRADPPGALGADRRRGPQALRLDRRLASRAAGAGTPSATRPTRLPACRPSTSAATSSSPPASPAAD